MELHHLENRHNKPKPLLSTGLRKYKPTFPTETAIGSKSEYFLIRTFHVPTYFLSKGVY